MFVIKYGTTLFSFLSPKGLAAYADSSSFDYYQKNTLDFFLTELGHVLTTGDNSSPKLILIKNCLYY